MARGAPVLVLVVLGVLAGVWGARAFVPLQAPASAESRPVAPRGDLAANEQSTVALFERSSPSVVHITTLDVRRGEESLEVRVTLESAE